MPSLSIADISNSIEDVHGWLSVREAFTLYQIASSLPSGLSIVEIGSYHGRSSIPLALGAKESDNYLYCIDPHLYHEAGGIIFTERDGVEFKKNIIRKDVARWIKEIDLPSSEVSLGWKQTIGLLFIDGAHGYDFVKFDFEKWTKSLSPIGKVMVHDSTGAWPDPTRVVWEALESGQWKVYSVIDQSTVLERMP